MLDSPDLRRLMLPAADAGEGDGLLSPSYELATSKFPKRDQLGIINQEFSAFARVSPADGGDPKNGFRSDIEGYFLADFPFLRYRSEGYSFLKPLRKEPSMNDCYSWILMVFGRGRADYLMGDRLVSFAPRDVCIRTPDNQDGGKVTDSDCFMFYLPPDRFGGLEDRLNWLGSVEGARRVHPLLGHYLVILGRILQEIPQTQAARVADTTAAMIRACISHLPDDVAAAKLPLQATRLEIARKYVDANLKSPDLTPRTILAVLGMSRRRMQDLFEGYGGVHNFIRARRLNSCYHAILTSPDTRPIAALAQEYGFSNVASFSRAFRSQFGWSPKDVRDMARINLNDSSYESWLTVEERGEAARDLEERSFSQ